MKMSLKECVHPRIESSYENLSNGKLEMIVNCVKYNRKFICYLTSYTKFNSDIVDIISESLYAFCESGEITFRKPKKLKALNNEYIAQFIIFAIENETNFNQLFKESGQYRERVD